MAAARTPVFADDSIAAVIRTSWFASGALKPISRPSIFRWMVSPPRTASSAFWAEVTNSRIVVSFLHCRGAALDTA